MISMTRAQPVDENLPRPALPSWRLMLNQLIGVPCSLPRPSDARKTRRHLFDGPEENDK
jgi:hypothetical protein